MYVEDKKPSTHFHLGCSVYTLGLGGGNGCGCGATFGWIFGNLACGGFKGLG